MHDDLPPAEALVLNVIHEFGKADVYEIVDSVNRNKDKNWKFQTVNTLCLRLEAKGFLSRSKAGRRVVYTPTGTRTTLFEIIIKKFFGSTLKRDPSPLISYLSKNEKLDEQDKNLLNELLKKITSRE